MLRKLLMGVKYYNVVHYLTKYRREYENLKIFDKKKDSFVGRKYIFV